MKIEKLELKHYAPYLAHEVLVRTPDQYGEIPDEFKMTVDNIDIIEANSFRMLLRPISDLTQKHLDELGWNSFQLPCERTNLIHYNLNWGTWQKLFEWHFDVFGLIPSGLALPKK